MKRWPEPSHLSIGDFRMMGLVFQGNVLLKADNLLCLDLYRTYVNIIIKVAFILRIRCFVIEKKSYCLQVIENSVPLPSF